MTDAGAHFGADWPGPAPGAHRLSSRPQRPDEQPTSKVFFNQLTSSEYSMTLCRFERYKNNTSAERGAVKSPGSSDEAFSPDEVEIVSLIWTNSH